MASSKRVIKGGSQMALEQQRFGGGWTEDKLTMVRKYLIEYVKALKYQQFKLMYIDAFAGTGYRDLKVPEETAQLLLPEFAETEPVDFIEGSASIA
jgi:three-Cys-motif partner protein